MCFPKGCEVFYDINVTCCDGSGGLEKARLSLVASWDTVFTAWSEDQQQLHEISEILHEIRSCLKESAQTTGLMSNAIYYLC